MVPGRCIALAVVASVGLPLALHAYPGNGSASAGIGQETPASICTEPTRDASQFSPRLWCELRLLRKRCNKIDRCLIDCHMTDDGKGIGGGCLRRCQEELGGVVWAPPEGIPHCFLMPSGELPEPRFRGKPIDHWQGRLRNSNVAVRRSTIQTLVASRKLVERGADLLVPALSEALRDSDQEVRVGATEALRQVGISFEEAFAPLLDALEHEDPAVRIGAMKALMGLGVRGFPTPPRPTLPPRTMTALLELVSDPSPDVRAATIHAFRNRGHGQGQNVCPAIVAALRDEVAAVRGAAATAVRNHCPKREQMLIADLLDDEDVGVRHRAILGVAALRSEGGSTIPQLAEVLRSPEAEIRKRAVAAIRAHGEFMKSKERYPETAAADLAVGLAALLQALDDEDFWVRLEATRALGDLEAEAAVAVPKLASMVTDATEQGERTNAAQALARIGVDPDGIAAEALVEALLTDNSGARSAARALARLGREAEAALAPGLVDLLRNGKPLTGLRSAVKELDPEVMEEIARVLGDELRAADDPEQRLRIAGYLDEIRWGARTAIPALIPVLRDDPDERVRAAVAGTLGRIRSYSAVDALVEALDDPSEMVRLRAETALHMLQSATDADVEVPELIGMLEDESVVNRRLAARALAAKGPDAVAALPALIKALDDEDERLTLAIRQCLEKLGPDAMPAVATLVASMGRDLPPATLRATRDTVVAIVQDSGFVPPSLVEALSDESSTVRWLTASALREIALPDAVALLAERLADPDDCVRFQAALATIETDASSTELAMSVLADALANQKPRRCGGLTKKASRSALVDATIEGLSTVSPENSSAIELHVRLLHHTDKRVRLHAIRYLSRGGSAAAATVPLLLDAMIDRDQEIQRAAAAALVRIEPASASPAVPFLLRDVQGNASIRREAIALLGAIRPTSETVIQVLRRALKDPDVGTRAAAINALAAVLPRNRDTVNFLMAELLKNQNSRLRAEDALWSVGPEAAAAVPTLLDELRNGSASAGAILRSIGPEAASAAPLLVEALQDPERDVRRVALVALGRIGPAASHWVDAIASALLDPEVGPFPEPESVLWALGPDAAAAVPLLLEALGERGAYQTAIALLRSIGPGAVDAVPALVQSLADDSDVVRRWPRSRSAGSVREHPSRHRRFSERRRTTYRLCPTRPVRR